MGRGYNVECVQSTVYSIEGTRVLGYTVYRVIQVYKVYSIHYTVYSVHGYSIQYTGYKGIRV